MVGCETPFVAERIGAGIDPDRHEKTGDFHRKKYFVFLNALTGARNRTRILKAAGV
jgi:hypothetical protein